VPKSATKTIKMNSNHFIYKFIAALTAVGAPPQMKTIYLATLTTSNQEKKSTNLLSTSKVVTLFYFDWMVEVQLPDEYYQSSYAADTECSEDCLRDCLIFE